MFKEDNLAAFIQITPVDAMIPLLFASDEVWILGDR